MELINTPRTSSIDEEKAIIEQINELVGDVPKVKAEHITRYIRDTGERKICVYETRCASVREMGFVINELQKKYPKDKIFATNSERYFAYGLE